MSGFRRKHPTGHWQGLTASADGLRNECRHGGAFIAKYSQGATLAKDGGRLPEAERASRFSLAFPLKRYMPNPSFADP